MSDKVKFEDVAAPTITAITGASPAMGIIALLLTLVGIAHTTPTPPVQEKKTHLPGWEPYEGFYINKRH